MFSFRQSRAKRFSNSRIRKLGAEQLESRQLFASDIGGYCLEWALESARLAASETELESSPRSSTKLSSTSPISAKVTKPTYGYSLIGNAGNSPSTATALGGLAIMGGSTDVNAAFSWMGQRAQGGDFVILSATSTTYGKYINSLASLDSVETLVIDSRAAADDPFVAQVVERAEAIFITGGDQANYVNYWSGTKLENAIYSAMINKNAVLGGTSAGLAIMGEVDFAALNGTISSTEALLDPSDPRITLDTQFVTMNDEPKDKLPLTPLKLLNDTLLESHFQQRDRMGRSMAFTANMAVGNMLPTSIKRDAIASPRTIALNEQTALLVEPNGTSYVVGNPYDRKLPVDSQRRSVFFIKGKSLNSTDERLPAGKLNYSASVSRFDWDPSKVSQTTFGINSWASNLPNVTYEVLAKNGVLSTAVATLYG